MTQQPDSSETLVFISHSSRDKSLAKEIVRALEAERINCWIDNDDITPGRDYNAEIIAGINACCAMIVLISRHSVESDPVVREVEPDPRYGGYVLMHLH